MDTVSRLADWEAGELEAMLVAYVERSGFDGIAPLPQEVAFSIATAQRLDRVVEF